MFADGTVYILPRHKFLKIGFKSGGVNVAFVFSLTFCSPVGRSAYRTKDLYRLKVPSAVIVLHAIQLHQMLCSDAID